MRRSAQSASGNALPATVSSRAGATLFACGSASLKFACRAPNSEPRRCILRGSEFGARHANFSEADPHANNVAPARELTVAGSALPEADWADLRIARTHKPPAGILAEGFLLFGAVYA